jgi:hypothetical protein
MKLRKYSFSTSQWATAKAKIETTDDEGNATWDTSKVVAVVELGNLVTIPAVYDEEGNETTPATYSDKYSVDILWVDEPLTTGFYNSMKSGVRLWAFTLWVGRKSVRNGLKPVKPKNPNCLSYQLKNYELL